jgi:hypothetical protein
MIALHIGDFYKVPVNAPQAYRGNLLAIDVKSLDDRTSHRRLLQGTGQCAVGLPRQSPCHRQRRLQGAAGAVSLLLRQLLTVLVRKHVLRDPSQLTFLYPDGQNDK